MYEAKPVPRTNEVGKCTVTGPYVAATVSANHAVISACIMFRAPTRNVLSENLTYLHPQFYPALLHLIPPLICNPPDQPWKHSASLPTSLLSLISQSKYYKSALNTPKRPKMPRSRSRSYDKRWRIYEILHKKCKSSFKVPKARDLKHPKTLSIKSRNVFLSCQTSTENFNLPPNTASGDEASGR